MEVDAGPILDYAAALTEESGVKVTVTHVVGKAVATGLQAEPAFNARVVLGRVVPLPRIDVSFGVDVGSGRDLAPVTLRAVDGLSTVHIAEALAERAGRLREGGDRDFARSNRWVRIAPWPLVRPAFAVASFWSGGLGRPVFGLAGFPFGSAFVSNIGGFDLDEGFLAPLPMARCPLYVCIGAIRERPAVVDGAVVARPVFVLTGTADHRLVDGAHVGRLVGALRTFLANPAKLDGPFGATSGK
jgi:pyruvate/2-oxoglutarate dehydrogenase complex dihydrolipoamide acyltransferase (E2) component